MIFLFILFIILGGLLGSWSVPYADWDRARRSADYRPEVYQEAVQRFLMGMVVAFILWKALFDPGPPNPDAGDPDFGAQRPPSAFRTA
jgi:hypothetical protein